MHSTSEGDGSFISWDRAWAEAATGPAGFWQTNNVTEHFRTASATALLATMIGGILRDHPEITRMIEIGAGDATLLTALHREHPHLRLTGIDLRPNPQPDTATDWLIGHWDVHRQLWQPDQQLIDPLLEGIDEPTLILCCEWLDELPCTVAIGDGDGWREVLVRSDGQERVGARLDTEAATWLSRWWSEPTPGARAEIGLHRDRAWAMVITALRRCGGTALMIDYGHRRGDRPPAGTLTCYANGRQLSPRPDPSVNLTAHVAVDAIAHAGTTAGGSTALLSRQAELVDQLAPDESLPTAAGPLARLQRAGERRALTGAFGRHWWLLQEVTRQT